MNRLLDANYSLFGAMSIDIVVVAFDWGGFFLFIMKFCMLRATCNPVEEFPRTSVLFLLFLEGLGGKLSTFVAIAPAGTEG